VSFRVIHHEPVCPDCGSFDITEEDVDTGDGLTETALICRTCGAAWPVACVTDWDTPDTNPRARRQPREGGDRTCPVTPAEAHAASGRART
jgi:hypothetical protein